MSTGYIKDGTTYVTQGPLQGREKFIRRIDRHKRLAWLMLRKGKVSGSCVQVWKLFQKDDVKDEKEKCSKYK